MKLYFSFLYKLLGIAKTKNIAINPQTLLLIIRLNQYSYIQLVPKMNKNKLWNKIDIWLLFFAYIIEYIQCFFASFVFLRQSFNNNIDYILTFTIVHDVIIILLNILILIRKIWHTYIIITLIYSIKKF